MLPLSFQNCIQSLPSLLHDNDASKSMDLYFSSVEQAVENWKLVQQIPDYHLVVGTILFKEYVHQAPKAAPERSVCFSEEANLTHFCSSSFTEFSRLHLRLWACTVSRTI
jgi:hypothetical protein